jgi:formyltetrahydrofolate-dependent phosphoribosylglycinamide formyltransferase
MSQRRIVVMLSGDGTNLQALIDAANAHRIEAEIVLVVSNKRDAYGLVRAEQAGIPTYYAPLETYHDMGRTYQEYDAALAQTVLKAQPDLVVLAGFNHQVSPAFLEHFPHKVINLHAALPGMFPGAHPTRRAFEAFHNSEIQHSGCMVHMLTPHAQQGDVIVQAVVPMHSGDSLEMFQTRMHAAEHQLIVQAVQHMLAQVEV